MEAEQSLKDKLVDFLIENPKHLQEIYDKFSEEKKSTIRGRLNENVGKCFKRISKGVYLSKVGDAQALIIEGDSWEAIKDIETGVIDTIITDSPYTCLDKHYQVGSTRKRNLEKDIGFKTQDMDKQLMQEMLRVLKPNGHFFCFLPSDAADTYEYNSNMIALAKEVGFTFNKRWIWDKMVIGMGYNGRNRHEQIIFFSKDKRRKPHDLSIPDVLTHKRIHANKRLHNAEKPVELIEDIMKFSNLKGDVVMDLFAGSLSTAQAGLNLGINTISMEIDGDMIKKSAKERGMKI
jgi:site-specific DNA-methyltransferase (adenine-specific)